jgi:hypothetical protein
MAGGRDPTAAVAALVLMTERETVVATLPARGGIHRFAPASRLKPSLRFLPSLLDMEWRRVDEVDRVAERSQPESISTGVNADVEEASTAARLLRHGPHTSK